MGVLYHPDYTEEWEFMINSLSARGFIVQWDLVATNHL